MVFFACQGEEEKAPSIIEVETTPEKQDTLLAQMAGISYDLMDEAIRFRSALQKNKTYRSGVYVYDSKSITTFKNHPEQLAARIALLGIKEIYLSISKTAIDGSDTNKYGWLKKFNRTAHQYGLIVNALRLESYNHFVSDDLIREECERIVNYNNIVASTERFDAVSADWEPHVLTKNGNDTPGELTYFWDSNTNYGIGKANDKLLQRTLEMLHLAKQNLNGLPVNEAIHYMYQNNFNAGLLSYGSTLQFLNECDFVSVMCYTNTKEAIRQRSITPLDNAQAKPQSVSICIKTSLNTYSDGGDTSTSLQPKGWEYLLESLAYFYNQAASQNAFRGIDFFEYEGLEKMWWSFEH
jgi:hypothetical protein